MLSEYNFLHLKACPDLSLRCGNYYSEPFKLSLTDFAFAFMLEQACKLLLLKGICESKGEIQQRVFLVVVVACNA